ncbi:MAG: 4-(cytidine 5'-diphospho)-2-C-methyl-D-erythritol kinase [Pyrinomonadaceae bacterium]
MSFTLPSFAKINLHLEVLGKRSDGYHDLCTIFQTVSLHDTLDFEKSGELRLTCDDPQIPTDGRNLIVAAANLLKERSNVDSGAEIHLEKRIPSPGGLGGGSSNAAAALVGLARLWDIEISMAELVEIAVEIGSDVPFFLYGGTAAGTGRGTDITRMNDFDGKYMLIVTPDVAVSTRKAFEGLNLTTTGAKSILNNCRFDGESIDLQRAALRNDFETTVFAAHPEIGNVKRTLLHLGARQALMSGSGASVFGIFDKEETRQATQKALEKNLNWRMFAVAAISRQSYREALGITF